jgi:hypothetical protein
MNPEQQKQVDKMLNLLLIQHKSAFWVWVAAILTYMGLLTAGILLLFTGKIHDGSLVTVASVLGHFSVSGFAKYNLVRTEKQILALLRTLDPHSGNVSLELPENNTPRKSSFWRFGKKR